MDATEESWLPRRPETQIAEKDASKETQIDGILSNFGEMQFWNVRFDTCSMQTQYNTNTKYRGIAMVIRWLKLTFPK